MAKSPSVVVRKLPWWIPLAGSAVIAFHLAALFFLSLAAQSGPWPVFYGVDMSPGPQFAGTINNVVYPNYLRPLGLTHNYHFTTDRPALDGVRFEVKLRDENGTVIKTLKFPEANANFWVKHRQYLLAQCLANDVPTQQRGTDKVGPKGGATPKQDYWLLKDEVRKLIEPGKEEVGKVVLPPVLDKHFLDMFVDPTTSKGKAESYLRISLEDTLAGNIPRSRMQMYRPAPWSLVLAKSYLRHLSGKFNAHSAELIRHSRPAVMPVYMFYAELPLEDGSFTEMIAHYGDLKLDFQEVQK